MEKITFIKVESLQNEDNNSTVELLACRVCLATDCKLFDLHKNQLAGVFGDLTGTQVSKTDGLPQHICHICYVLLKKSAAFRAKCRKVHVLLQDARVRQPLMTTEHIKTIDRTKLMLSLSLADPLTINYTPEPEKDKDSIGCKYYVTNEQNPLVSNEPNIYDLTYEQNPHVKNEPCVYDESNDQNPIIKNEPDIYDLITNEQKHLVNNEPHMYDESNEQNLLVKNEPDIYDLTNEQNPFVNNEPDVYESNEQSPLVNNEPDVYESNEQNSLVEIELEPVITIDDSDDCMESDYINYEFVDSPQSSLEGDIELMEDNIGEEKDESESSIIYAIEPRKRKADGDTIEIEESNRKIPFLNNKKCEKDLVAFAEIYNCEVVFLTKEQQLKEVQNRKFSENFRNARFKCNKCYMGFTNASAHKRHMRTHDEVNGEHLCEICQVRYPTRIMLRNHRRKHSYTFVCNTCNHVSKFSNLAVAHFKCHKGFIYKCKECYKPFKELSSYRNHKRKSHSLITCKICYETVTGFNGLEVHNIKKHIAEFPSEIPKTVQK